MLRVRTAAVKVGNDYVLNGGKWWITNGSGASWYFVLAAIDADGNGLLVCPVCGAVLEIEDVYGHIVPVVLDMELHRPQPKARLHPLATLGHIGGTLVFGR